MASRFHGWQCRSIVSRSLVGMLTQHVDRWLRRPSREAQPLRDWGGGTTPLVGDKKVEIMLGLQRDGAAKLPSPPVKVRKG